MFFNSFAKSILFYRIVTYVSAAKDHLHQIEITRRRILRANSSGKSMIVLNIYLNGKNCLYSKYTYWCFSQKFSFQQLRTESPLSLLDTADNPSYHTTSKKGLLSIPYCRTVTELKSVENRLRQSYN